MIQLSAHTLAGLLICSLITGASLGAALNMALTWRKHAELLKRLEEMNRRLVAPKHRSKLYLVRSKPKP